MEAFKKISLKCLKLLLIALFWILVWAICAKIMNLPILFPSPVNVLKRFFELLGTKEFYLITGSSLYRVFSGIIIGILIGSILAVLCSISKLVYDIFYPVITVIKSTPIASFVLLIWLFIGDQITPIIITVIMVLPIVWANIYKGIESIDKNLIEVCRAYKIPIKKRISAFYVPSIMPFFVSSLLSGIGLAWKAGVAAEVLCSTKRSMGEEIWNAKYDIERAVDLYAWTVAVILISLVFELVFSKLIKKLLNKYIKSTGGSNEN